MILFSKFSPQLAVNKQSAFTKLVHQVTVETRLFSSEVKDPSVTRIRNVKRFFAFGLFGVTLAIAFTVKRRKKKEWTDLLAKTNRTGNFGQLVLFEYEHYMLPKPVLEILEKIKRFQFRETDVVLSSFPKTGTTWLSEIIWLLTNNLDYKTARNVSISDRFPYLEWPTPGLNSIDKSTKNIRLVKTHLPISILWKGRDTKPRIISIVRDPKDVLVSFYHFARMNNIIDFQGNFEEFLELFLQDKVAYGPIYRFYRELEKSKHELEGKLLVIKYENLTNNFEQEIEILCSFLGLEPLSDRDMKMLKSHCSFNEMQINPSVNYEHWDDLGLRKRGESKFMRKGIVGDWKAHFSPEQKEKFDQWFTVKTNALKPVDEIDVKLNIVT